MKNFQHHNSTRAGTLAIVPVGLGSALIGAVLIGSLLVGVGQASATDMAFTTDTISVVNPVAVLAADFDNDGYNDLAVASTASNSIRLFLSNGNAPSTWWQNTYASPSPWALAIGDFNGDGRKDLVASNLLHGNLTLLLGAVFPNPITGPFVSPVTVNLPSGSSHPSDIEVGDLNADGFDDVVVVNRMSQTVAVLFGDGQGAFPSHAILPQPTFPAAVAVGDFTGDGHDDLFVTNTHDSNFRIIHGNGVGAFPTTSTFALGVDDTIWSVTCKDVNGDLAPDIIAPCRQVGAVAILINTPGVAPYFWAQTVVAGSQPAESTATFLDADSNLDLVTVNSISDNVSLRFGTSPGNFEVTQTLLPAGQHCVSLSCTDLDGDGRTDIAVANQNGGTVTLFFNANEPFLRGDVNIDGHIDIGDVVRLLQYLFQLPDPLSCADSADVDDSGILDLGDVVLLLNQLFSTATAASTMASDCGEDVGADSLAPCSYDVACP
ncbi:MAG: FG-GAP-like repeat-containing protein [Planctomycetota bacterium]